VHDKQQHLFPPFRLDPVNAQLWQGERELALRPKTFEVLRYLVDHAGQLVTKAALLDAVWPDVTVSDLMPTICVKELRKALGDDARSPRLIQTVHRLGYRFIAKVTTTGIGEETRTAPDVPKGPKPIMVGREQELVRLHDLYSHVLEGRRGVIFVTGEVGIGKTTFAQAFLDSTAREGSARLAHSQCVEQYGAGEPYMPVLEALTRLCREPSGSPVVKLLRKFAPTWLAQMPSILDEADLKRLHQNTTQRVMQQRMLREMTQALETLAADAPLMLLFEDLHWSDFSTLELISAIARRSEAARLLVIGTYRPVEMLAHGHPLRTMKEELELHCYCEELRLKLLDECDIEGYLARRFAGSGSRRFDRLATIIHQRTEGNPLFYDQRGRLSGRSGAPDELVERG
jgi:DNA-binding winged helix-turn-helix (wHTH) protein